MPNDVLQVTVLVFFALFILLFYITFAFKGPFRKSLDKIFDKIDNGVLTVKTLPPTIVQTSS